MTYEQELVASLKEHVQYVNTTITLLGEKNVQVEFKCDKNFTATRCWGSLKLSVECIQHSTTTIEKKVL